MLSGSKAGFNAVQEITKIFVQCCLNNICELKYKQMLIHVIHKQLLCFQKLSNFNDDSF